MTRQEVSIVSEVAGTTTDPVEKPMELLPLGPVLFIDTAGIDDAGALGEKRVQKTRQVFDRTDVGMIVVDAGRVGRVRGGDPPTNCASARRPADRGLQQVRPGAARRGRCWTHCARRKTSRASRRSPPTARACSSCARR